MTKLVIRQIIDLVEADVGDGEGRIQQVFQWKFDREMEVAKWVLGLSASLLAATFAGFILENTAPDSSTAAKFSLDEAVASFALVAASATYGIVLLFRLRRHHEQFVGALNLYGRLKQLAPFVARYRGSS